MFTPVAGIVDRSMKYEAINSYVCMKYEAINSYIRIIMIVIMIINEVYGYHCAFTYRHPDISFTRTTSTSITPKGTQCRII